MMKLIEKVKSFPESTRFIVVNVIFLVIAGIILSGWIWQVTGAFPYDSVTTAFDSAAGMTASVGEAMINLQLKLGGVKQDLNDAVHSSYKTDNYDSLQSLQEQNVEGLDK
mgnify:CR=1 FL=1